MRSFVALKTEFLYKKPNCEPNMITAIIAIGSPLVGLKLDRQLLLNF